MSIYPVHLIEWYPPGDEMYDTCHFMVEVNRCLSCGARPSYKKAWGHHSIPWGHGDIWCNEKCLKSKKTYRLDKRQKRKLKRSLKRSGWLDLKIRVIDDG